MKAAQHWLYLPLHFSHICVVNNSVLRELIGDIVFEIESAASVNPPNTTND